MAKKNIQKKPITSSQFQKLIGKHDLTDLILGTGARIREAKRIVDEYVEGNDYVDIVTKKSEGVTNRFYLTPSLMNKIMRLRKLYGEMSVRNYTRKITEISKEVGIEFTAHNLRATFATRLMENGVDIVSVQHLMHHSNISQTAEYIQFTEARLRPAIEMLEDYETFEGLTFYELQTEYVRQREKIRRLEKKLESLISK